LALGVVRFSRIGRGKPLLVTMSSHRPGDSALGSLRPSARPEGMSQSPRSKDTAGVLFLGGEHYYRQIDDLCMNICVAKKIDDTQWKDFLEESLRLTHRMGRQGTGTIASFAHAHPSAVQRRLTSEFLARHNVPTMARMGVHFR
jgi:hypothetical protein